MVLRHKSFEASRAWLSTDYFEYLGDCLLKEALSTEAKRLLARPDYKTADYFGPEALNKLRSFVAHVRACSAAALASS